MIHELYISTVRLRYTKLGSFQHKYKYVFISWYTFLWHLVRSYETTTSTFSFKDNKKKKKRKLKELK